jgi:pimeloyl-ACP methyl ester carboxylesterase
MDLFYRKFGAGSPLLILHGLFGLSDNWISIGKQLSKYFEVYLLDLRNHGQSPRSHEFSHEIMAEDVADFCEKLKLRWKSCNVFVKCLS